MIMPLLQTLLCVLVYLKNLFINIIFKPEPNLISASTTQLSPWSIIFLELSRGRAFQKLSSLTPLFRLLISATASPWSAPSPPPSVPPRQKPTHSHHSQRRRVKHRESREEASSKPTSLIFHCPGRFSHRWETPLVTS
ncbi:hypothetical protein V6N11_002099 [Hibiscus sabdariffa]|uniref:Uncharacterized protein n=1 Tax=Hibiscus sabdariffa TaxID=183260 RepID=A0ABR2QV14_9ROSI